MPTMKMTFTITDYTVWDDQINDAAQIFHAKYSIYPNLMLANRKTWDRIEKQLYFIGSGKPVCAEFASEEEKLEYWKKHLLQALSGVEEKKNDNGPDFLAADYSLHFCLEEELENDSCILVFDEDPTFDGEPWDDPAEDENEQLIYKRIA